MSAKLARKVARLLLTIVGIFIGPAIITMVDGAFSQLGYLGLSQVFLPWAVILVYALAGLVTGIIIFIISPRIINDFTTLVKEIETKMSEFALSDIFFGVVGLLIGLLIAFLLSTLTDSIPSEVVKLAVNIVMYAGLGYLGWTIVTKRRGEINVPTWFKRGSRDKTQKGGGTAARPKVLDTSVIIDGRIFDICKTGIIEGTLIIPGFVLRELRHIADSSDALKRNRGRRGLDILKCMQEELNLKVQVVETEYEDIAEVDLKLLKLAFDMNGVVVTNDYNLNKVAGVQKVPVFNINELANAIKPVVLPGEEMDVVVMKEGKEQNQGVAYLDDGTMIVVDGGRRVIGEDITVIVTSVLQTAAGRMIFAKIK